MFSLMLVTPAFLRDVVSSLNCPLWSFLIGLSYVYIILIFLSAKGAQRNYHRCERRSGLHIEPEHFLTAKSLYTYTVS